MKEIFVHREDMPKGCFHCPFIDTASDFPNFFCNVTCDLLPDEVDIDKERPENCPIKIVEEYAK